MFSDHTLGIDFGFNSIAAGYSRSRNVGPVVYAQNEPSTTQAALPQAPEIEPGKKIELKDIANAKFEVPAVKPVPVIRMDDKAPEKIETAAPAEKLNNVATAYMAANREAMEQIRSAMAEADPEGGAAFDGLHAKQGSGIGTIIVAAATAPVDPTLGYAATTLDALRAHYSNPDNPAANRAIAKALDKLRSQSNEQKLAHQFNPISTQPAFDFTKIQTPEQLRGFIERDPTKDGLMQEITLKKETLDKTDNVQNNYEKESNSKPTASKICAAVTAGDTGKVKKLTGGDDAKTTAVMAGAKVEDIQQKPSLMEAEHTSLAFDTANSMKSILMKGSEKTIKMGPFTVGVPLDIACEENIPQMKPAPTNAASPDSGYNQETAAQKAAYKMPTAAPALA